MSKTKLKDNEFMILRGKGKFDVVAVDEKDICIKKTLKGKEMLVVKHEGRNLTKFAKKELLDKYRRCYRKSFKKNTRKSSKRTLAKRRTKRLQKKLKKSKSKGGKSVKSKGGKSRKSIKRRVVRKK